MHKGNTPEIKNKNFKTRDQTIFYWGAACLRNDNCVGEGGEGEWDEGAVST